MPFLLCRDAWEVVCPIAQVVAVRQCRHDFEGSGGHRVLHKQCPAYAAVYVMNARQAPHALLAFIMGALLEQYGN